MHNEPRTSFFRDRDFRSVNSATPFADLLHRSGAFGGEERGAEHEERALWDLNFEATGHWDGRALRQREDFPEPARYVDGAARASLIAWGRGPGGNLSAVVGGVIGALAARIVDRRIESEPEVEPGQHGQMVVSLAQRDFPRDDLDELARDLARSGIALLTPDAPPEADDRFGSIERLRVSAHTAVTSQMGILERKAIDGTAGQPPDLTVVDGNLSSHLTERKRHPWALVGVVKRHHMQDIPDPVALCALGLRVGERTPAAVLRPRDDRRPPMVTWYQKIRGDHGATLTGVIRVELPLPFLDVVAPAGRTTSWIDGLGRRLLEARATRGSYSREDCSLQPVLLIEDRLHRRAGTMDAIRLNLYRALDIPNGGRL